MARLNLTANQKALADIVLSIAGFIIGTIVQNAGAFKGTFIEPYISIIGLVGGYAITEFTTIVDGPIPATVPPTA